MSYEVELEAALETLKTLLPDLEHGDRVTVDADPGRPQGQRINITVARSRQA